MGTGNDFTWVVTTTTYKDGQPYKVFGLDFGSEIAEDKMAKEEPRMDPAVAAVYEKTKDAVLVSQYFGGISLSHDAFLRELFLRQHKDEILAEAKRRDAEYNAKTKS